MQYHLKFSNIGDDYLLGVICFKTGLTEYVLSNLKGLKRRDRKKLFEMGMKDSNCFKLEDIAGEILDIRLSNPIFFDKKVRKKIGNYRLKEMKFCMSKFLSSPTVKKVSPVDLLIEELKSY